MCLKLSCENPAAEAIHYSNTVSPIGTRSPTTDLAGCRVLLLSMRLSYSEGEELEQNPRAICVAYWTKDRASCITSTDSR